MSETQETCWTRLKQSNELLNRYRERGRQLSDLLTDLELVRENNEIYFIVDFSEIYVLASVDEYNDREGQIRKETTATLLSLYGTQLPHYGIPVLINPYRTESRRKVLELKRKISQKEIQLNKSEGIKNEKLEIMKEKLLKISSGHKISREDTSDIINTLKEFGLHDLLRGEPKAKLKMLEEIGKLIDKNSLPVDIQRKSLVMHPNIGNSDYFRALLLLSAKKGDFHLVNDYIDSQALELVDLVNNEESDLILLFYSGTQHMKDLLGRGREFGPLIEKRQIPLGEFRLPGREETLNFLRTPEMMAELFYLMKSRKDWEKEIKEKNARIGKIVGSGAPIRSFLDTCPMDEAKCENRKKCQSVLREIEANIDEHDELIDAVNICGIFANYRELFKIARQSLRKDEEIVQILKDNMEEIEIFFQKEKDALLYEIDVILDQLNRQFISLFQFETFDRLRIRLRRLRGKPYYIFFYNRFIKERINDLIELIEGESKRDTRKLSKIKKKYTDLIDCISRKELGYERNLLLATLLFAHSYYDEATDLSQEEMRVLPEHDEVYREFCLISVLSNYMRYLRDNNRIFRTMAKNRCEKFCEDYKDPRFCNALGVIQLSIIVDEGKDIDERIESKVLPYFMEALQYVEKSEKDFGDLEFVLKNNKADTILTKEELSSKELKDVEDLLNEIKDMEYFMFNDTMAKFYERKFRQANDEKYLEMAIGEYEKAIRLAMKQEADEFSIRGIVENSRELLEKALELSRKDSVCLLDKTLVLRCFFYHYAHSRDENIQERSLREIKALLEKSAISPGWNLSENVERAIKDGHPHPDFLDKLARVISKKTDIKELSNFELWEMIRFNDSLSTDHPASNP